MCPNGAISVLDSSKRTMGHFGASPKKAKQDQPGTNHGNGDYGGHISNGVIYKITLPATTNPGAVAREVRKAAAEQLTTCLLVAAHSASL